LDNIVSVSEKDDSATGKMVTYVGQHYDVEPPMITDDPFFGHLIITAIEEGLRRNESWAIRQKNMIYDIYWFPIETRLAPGYFRNYFRLATGNLENDNWPMYVPSFQATEAEIDEVKQKNIDWKHHCEKLAREHDEFMEEMAVLDQINEWGEYEGYKRIYINHCWKCRATIDSRECVADPGYGYFCNRCGVSLRTRPYRY
jgi:hypothetical protein